MTRKSESKATKLPRSALIRAFLRHGFTVTEEKSGQALIIGGAGVRVASRRR